MPTLKQLRIEAGLKPGELCTLADVKYPILYKLESGRSRVSDEKTVKVLRALNRALGTAYTLKDIEGAQK